MSFHWQSVAGFSNNSGNSSGLLRAPVWIWECVLSSIDCAQRRASVFLILLWFSLPLVLFVVDIWGPVKVLMWSLTRNSNFLFGAVCCLLLRKSIYMYLFGSWDKKLVWVSMWVCVFLPCHLLPAAVFLFFFRCPLPELGAQHRHCLTPRPY